MESSKMPPLCPMIPIHFGQSYSHFPPTTSGEKEKAKTSEGLTSSYYRSPSESLLLLDGQPSWLDDLLNDTDTETETHKTRVQRSHRRSASDTSAFVESTTRPFDVQLQGHFYKNVNCKTSNTAQKSTSSLEEKFKKDLNLSESRSVEGHERVESASSQNLEGSIDGSTQANPSLSKKDAKRSKQQFAHRSRVRKLQYISQLEKAVQILHAEGSDIVAELHFVDQQNLILSMENRSLKQQLDSITQEQLIKQLEHEMLERELGRLQASYQFQMQQQMQMQQHQQNQKNRRTKNREPGLIRGSKNGSVQ